MKLSVIAFRGKKVENGATTYYLRSSVLGGQVVSEFNSSGGWMRGYVYLGGQLVAIQSNLAVSTVHQDPITKSQRITDSSGNVTSTIVDLDTWGGETGRSSNQAAQPHRYTSYERDANGGDDAMFRRYQSSNSRFPQPDPYDGSYNLTDPLSHSWPKRRCRVESPQTSHSALLKAILRATSALTNQAYSSVPH